MLNNADLENNWSDVVLLLPFDNGFIDVKNNYGPTATTGTPSITNNQYTTKYGTGAAAFNGTLDTARYQHGADTTIGTGDFTIEFWAYFSRFGTVGGGSTSNGYRGVFTNHTVLSTSSNSRSLTVHLDVDKLYLQIGGITLGDFFTISTDRWFHIAISREGTNIRFFVDGNIIHTYSGAAYDFSTNTFILGGANYATSGSNWGYFAGFIDDFRFTKGFARYTETFNTPAAALSIGDSVRTPVNFFPQIRLFADNGVDNSSYSQKAINNRRNPPSVTYDSEFFNGSAAFYFNRNPITTYPDLEFRIGTNDFTIEAWVNISADTTTPRAICASYGFPTVGNYWFGIHRNVLQVRYGTSSNYTESGSYEVLPVAGTVYTARVPYDRWAHVAWSRKGDINRLFIDGKVAVTFTDSTNWVSRSVTFGHKARAALNWKIVETGYLWFDQYEEGDWFVGYMNDIKFSNMICKYTGDFNPKRGVVNDRPVELSKFNQSLVAPGSFDAEFITKIETDRTTNSNIFWFNDDTGFVLQKKFTNTPGVRIGSAMINTSNQLVLTLSNGSIINVGDVIGNPITLAQSKVSGTGVLKEYNSGNYEFVPIVGGGDVRLVGEGDWRYLTSVDMPQGTSFDGAVRVTTTYNAGTGYNSTSAPNVWSKVTINGIAENTIDALLKNDSTIVLPPGTYYVIGESNSYSSPYHHSMRVYNETLATTLLQSASDIYDGFSTQNNHIEGHFSLITETTLSIQTFITAENGSAQSMAASRVITTFNNFIFFKVG